MRTRLRSTALAAVAVAAALVLGACGNGGSADAGDDGGFTVGVLLPSAGPGRFGHFDGPLIEQRLKQECPDCRSRTVVARDDPAAQQEQMEAMITDGVRVMILDAVDARAVRSSVRQAHQAGIPVVAYDRLAEGPISGFVSFDGVQVGRLQGEALLEAMADRGRGNRTVMMNGPATDPNATLFKQGALSVLQGRAAIRSSYATVGWQQSNARTNMISAISQMGAKGIDGVLAANDTIATGVVTALRAARISPIPPVTGQDADLIAVRRIVAGDQYMTVYKPFRPEARAAADMAIALARGQSIGTIAGTTVANGTAKDIPAVLLVPIPVTAGNIGNTLVKDGMYTVAEICAPDLRAACARLGLTP